MNNTYKRASTMIRKAKGPKWKRELVSDHKFDYVDIDEFRNNNCWLQIKYMALYCSVIKSFAVYGADLWSAGILLIYDRWSLSTQPQIPFYISKWIYVGCIALSFILLAWEIRKTRNVMATRDISLAVTNPLAYRTYSVKSYSYFCLLHKINSSTKWSDVITFYVFYTLKGWKKVIVAQGPRQIIAGITVYALLKSAWTNKQSGAFEFSTNWDDYGNDSPQRMALILMAFTCLMWIFSALSILLAIALYIPVFCRIQGNLKEYCCHKIDKRIDEIIEKQRKNRIKEREKYANSISSKKSKKNAKNKDDFALAPAVPTLPVINNVDLYAKDNKSAWMYQQQQQQQQSYPQTPYGNNNYLSDSSYSLQHTPSYTNNTNNYGGYHQPVPPQAAYTTHDTGGYFYSPTVTPAMTPATSTASKPNTYDDYYQAAPPPLPQQKNTTNYTSDTYYGSNMTDVQMISDNTAYYNNNNNNNQNMDNDSHSNIQEAVHRSDSYSMTQINNSNNATHSPHQSFNTADRSADTARNYQEVHITPAVSQIQRVDVEASETKKTTYNNYI